MKIIMDGSQDLKISLKSLDNVYSTVLLYYHHSLEKLTSTFDVLVDRW